MVRPGYLAFSTVSLGAGRPQGGQRVYLNTAIPSAASTAFTLIGWNGGVYNLSDSGGWLSTTPQLSGLSTATDLVFPHDRDLVAVMDGSTTPYKSTNGSSWTAMGIQRPTVAPTLSSATGLAEHVGVRVLYTYKDRDLAYESNGQVAGSTITLTATGRSMSGRAEQHRAGGGRDCRLRAQQDERGDGPAQGELAGAIGRAPTARSSSPPRTGRATTKNRRITIRPRSLSFGVVWKNRWWARSATVKNRIHFTQLFQPQSWPALFFLDIPFERGDEIRALVPMGDTLIVFGTTRIFLLVGQTSLDFEVRPTLGSQEGAFGPFATCIVENGVIHVGANGVYIFDGTTDRYLSFDIEPAWRDLVKNSAVADLQRIAVCMTASGKKCGSRCRAGIPRAPSANGSSTSIAPAKGGEAWTATDRTIGGYIQFNGPEAQAGDRGRLFSWHSSIARVFEESTARPRTVPTWSRTTKAPG
jgi:hypothetical protein